MSLEFIYSVNFVSVEEHSVWFIFMKQVTVRSHIMKTVAYLSVNVIDQNVKVRKDQVALTLR
jgi:hypothetical protein